MVIKSPVEQCLKLRPCWEISPNLKNLCNSVIIKANPIG